MLVCPKRPEPHIRLGRLCLGRAGLGATETQVRSFSYVLSATTHREGRKSLNELLALVAVLIGTGGLASLLSGVASLQRTRRLQKRLRELHKASQFFEPTRQEATALEAAKALTALDLAASVLIKSRALGRLTFGITVLAVVGVYSVWIGLGGYSPLVLAPSDYSDAPLVALGTVALGVAEVFWVVRNYLLGDVKARERIIRELRSPRPATDHLSIIDAIRPELSPAALSSEASRAESLEARPMNAR